MKFNVMYTLRNAQGSDLVLPAVPNPVERANLASLLSELSQNLLSVPGTTVVGVNITPIMPPLKPIRP